LRRCLLVAGLISYATSAILSSISAVNVAALAQRLGSSGRHFGLALPSGRLSPPGCPFGDGLMMVLFAQLDSRPRAPTQALGLVVVPNLSAQVLYITPSAEFCQLPLLSAELLGRAKPLLAGVPDIGRKEKGLKLSTEGGLRATIERR